MTAFRVNPDDLREHASTIERSEPFTALGRDAVHLPVPSEPSATAASLDRMRQRLHAELIDLATGTASLTRTTASAADQYRLVEADLTRRWAAGR